MLAIIVRYYRVSSGKRGRKVLQLGIRQVGFVHVCKVKPLNWRGSPPSAPGP